MRPAAASRIVRISEVAVNAVDDAANDHGAEPTVTSTIAVITARYKTYRRTPNNKRITRLEPTQKTTPGYVNPTRRVNRKCRRVDN